MHHDLVKLINESRIVINFSKNEFLKSKYLGSKKYKSYYQFKGRIYQSGLCGTACITEYSPAHELIFKELYRKELVRIFKTIDITVEEQATGEIAKHRANVEVYLTNPVGIGEHSDITEAIGIELDKISRYHDQVEVINKYFKLTSA